MKMNRCGDCFKWNTRDCELFLPHYPNMPIWDKSIPCNQFVPSDSSETVITGGACGKSPCVSLVSCPYCEENPNIILYRTKTGDSK